MRVLFFRVTFRHMPNKQQREQNRKNFEALLRRIDSPHPCPNCKATVKIGQGHFVPPSLGEEGFYICERRA